MYTCNAKMMPGKDEASLSGSFSWVVDIIRGINKQDGWDNTNIENKRARWTAGGIIAGGSCFERWDFSSTQHQTCK